MEGRRPWQRSTRFEQRKKKKSEGRRKEKEEEDAGEREELAARMRTAKEAVRHGRGRASRTALAGGVRGQFGHGLVSVCVDASTISANDYINLSIILIKVIITWVVTSSSPLGRDHETTPGTIS